MIVLEVPYISQGYGKEENKEYILSASKFLSNKYRKDVRKDKKNYLKFIWENV